MISIDENSPKFILSLVPIKIVAAVMIVGPWIALGTSYVAGVEYLGLGADRGLLYQYSVYAALLIALIFAIKSKLVVILPCIQYIDARRYQSRLFKWVLCALAVVFLLAGMPMLFDSLNRGEVRISLGIFGPFYTFVINFMLPAATCCNHVLYCYLGRTHLRKTLLIYALIFAAAFLTGYKSSVIMIFLPLIACLWPTTSFTHKLLIASVAIITIIASHLLIENFDGTLMESVEYNMARTTSVAAYGLLGAWDMSRTENLELVPLVADSLFGSHIAPVVTDLLGGSHGQVPGDAAKLVTIEYYPDRDSAEAGSVNLTLTLFGELILLFHQLWVVWFTVFIVIVRIFLKRLRAKLCVGDIRAGVLMLVFIVFGILPIVSSSGIFTIFALPTIAYLCATHFFLKYVLPPFAT